MIDLPPDFGLVANTPRLRLTPVTRHDAAELRIVLDDHRLHRYSGGSPASEAELAERFARWQGHRSPDGREVWIAWVVRLVPLGEGIGYVQATVFNDGTARLQCVIGSRWSRNGFATEALLTTARTLEAHAGVTRLEACVHEDDNAARAVARHLGLRRTQRREGEAELWVRGRRSRRRTAEERVARADVAPAVRRQRSPKPS